MHVRRTDAGVTVHAPAKVNLFLEVLARRADGFHEIETLMTAVSFGDTLQFTPQAVPRVEFDCRWGCGITARRARGSGETSSDVPSGPDNLAWRAVELLRQRAGEG